MQNEVKKGHVGVTIPLLEFWDPVIFRKHLKQQTSNLAKRCIWQWV